MFVRPSCWYGSAKSDKRSPRKCLILSKNARKHFAWRQTQKRQKKNIGSSTAIERTDIWDAWIGLACSGYLSRTIAQFTYLCLHALMEINSIVGNAHFECLLVTFSKNTVYNLFVQIHSTAYHSSTENEVSMLLQKI